MLKILGNGRAFHIINNSLLILYAFICFYPFYYILIYSISDPNQANIHGVWLWPAKLSFLTYKQVLNKSGILDAFVISASRAVIGTIITVLCSSFLGYLVSKKDMFLRKFIYRFTVATMYLSAGLIPWYITMKNLGLKDNYLLYILPSAIGAFYVVLVKTYIENIPPSLEESAMVDGAKHLTIFFKLILPLSMPIIATIAIFSAVTQWNSWQDNLYLVNNPKLSTLQLLLYNILSTDQASSIADRSNLEQVAANKNFITPMSVKMTMSMVTVIPILIVYPALQKYFVKGIMLGAVKG